MSMYAMGFGQGSDIVLLSRADRKKLSEERLELEKMELEAPGHQAPPEVYGRLMLIYLIQKEMCLAKFLWKRVPEEVKKSVPELESIWAIGRGLLEMEYSDVHTALKGDWNPAFQPYINILSNIIREDLLKTIGKTYTSISVADFSKLTGASSESEAVVLAQSRDGWRYDEASKFILPKPPARVEIEEPRTTEKLTQLTNYVAFLEK